ncbi:MAG: hypothetical protein LUQ38_03245 [Methanotrichaceae archaeon]|nr:hypothetical protein [Methanotrichaceae archaeon]
MISLAWMTFSEDGSTRKVEYFYRAEVVRLGIPYDLLLDAALEGGGSIDGSGHYPVRRDHNDAEKGRPSKAGQEMEARAHEIKSHGSWQTMVAN